MAVMLGRTAFGADRRSWVHGGVRMGTIGRATSAIAVTGPRADRVQYRVSQRPNCTPYHEITSNG